MTSSRVVNGSRLPRRVAGGVAVLATLPVVVILMSVLAGGEAGLLVVLFAALEGWTLPVLALALIPAALSRSRGVLGWVAGVSAVALLVTPPWPHGGGESDAGALSLRVMVLNLEFGRADPSAVVALVRRAGPDVVVLNEVSARSVAALDAAGLAELMPYSVAYPRDDASGSGLWSTTPLISFDPIDGTRFHALRARVRPFAHAVAGGRGGTRTRSVTVFAVHPAPPQMRADWLADYRLMRTQVATALASGEPVVLAGDLNAAPTNGPLRRLLGAGLTDTATATRWTWQDLTWPADRPFPPVIRIDHVLAGGGVTPSRLAAVAIPGTDHRAVVADLLLPAGGRPTP